MKNLAVIGAGYWGKNLVRNFHELGVLKTVCDSNQDTQSKLRENFPGLHLTGDLPAVLADPVVQAVAIATPAESHYAIARMALEAGKHVFVEKPLCLKVEEA